MQLFPALNDAGTKVWTPALFFGVLERLPFRSRVRSQLHTLVREEKGMRRYVITCDFYRAKRAAAVGDTIRRIASEWQHPLSNMWIVETALNAGAIRSALLSHLDFQDRIYICEAGDDVAEFNALPISGGKVTHIDQARGKSRLLASIFSRNGGSSRHLKAAISGNLKSA